MHAANHFLDKKKESLEVYTLSNCYKNIPCARRPSLPALPNSWTIDSKVGGHPILIIVSTSGWSMPMSNAVVQTFGSRANHGKLFARLSQGSSELDLVKQLALPSSYNPVSLKVLSPCIRVENKTKSE